MINVPTCPDCGDARAKLLEDEIRALKAEVAQWIKMQKQSQDDAHEFRVERDAALAELARLRAQRDQAYEVIQQHVDRWLLESHAAQRSWTLPAADAEMSNLDDYIRKQENARLTEERDHWKQARESAMAADEVLQAENARLKTELCTKCGTELTYHHHWGDGPEHDEHTPERCLTMQLEEAERERAAVVAEIVADLRGQAAVAWRPGNESNDTHNALREAADAIEAKFAATDQPKERP